MSDLDTSALNAVVKSIGIENIFIALAIPIKVREDKVWFSSPFREDRHPSVCCYLSNFFCIDFASEWKGSIFKLFREVTGRSLFNFFSIDNSFLLNKTFEGLLAKEKKRDSFEFIKKIRIASTGASLEDISGNKLASEYCKKRDISQKIIEEFKIQFATNCVFNDTSFVNRLCIPVYHDNKLVSIEGRDITGKAKRKVLYPRKASVSTLFNYANLDPLEPLVVVEGLMDLVKIWLYITKNVTTPFGVYLTDTQEILFKNFKKIILFPDDDQGGEALIKKFDEFYPYEFEIAKVKNKDPGASFAYEIEEAFNKRVSAIEYFIDKYKLFENSPVETTMKWEGLL